MGRYVDTESCLLRARDHLGTTSADHRHLVDQHLGLVRQRLGPPEHCSEACEHEAKKTKNEQSTPFFSGDTQTWRWRPLQMTTNTSWTPTWDSSDSGWGHRSNVFINTNTIVDVLLWWYANLAAERLCDNVDFFGEFYESWEVYWIFYNDVCICMYLSISWKVIFVNKILI